MNNEITEKARAYYEARRTPLRPVNKISEPVTLIGDAVLDCFAGSGTTGRVAKAMGRVPICVKLTESICNYE